MRMNHSFKSLMDVTKLNGKKKIERKNCEGKDIMVWREEEEDREKTEERKIERKAEGERKTRKSSSFFNFSLPKGN